MLLQQRAPALFRKAPEVSTQTFADFQLEIQMAFSRLLDNFLLSFYFWLLAESFLIDILQNEKGIHWYFLPVLMTVTSSSWSAGRSKNTSFQTPCFCLLSVSSYLNHTNVNASDFMLYFMYLISKYSIIYIYYSIVLYIYHIYYIYSIGLDVQDQ